MAAKKNTAAPGTAQHMAASRKGGARKPQPPLPVHDHKHGRDQLMHHHGPQGQVTRHSS